MTSKAQLVVNDDFFISSRRVRDNIQRYQVDPDVLLYECFGWEDHNFCFGKIQLKMSLFHPGRDVRDRH